MGNFAFCLHYQWEADNSLDTWACRAVGTSKNHLFSQPSHNRVTLGYNTGFISQSVLKTPKKIATPPDTKTQNHCIEKGKYILTWYVASNSGGWIAIMSRGENVLTHIYISNEKRLRSRVSTDRDRFKFSTYPLKRTHTILHIATYSSFSCRQNNYFCVFHFATLT